MQYVKQYSILISCPSDVKEEIKIIEQEIYDFNKSEGKTNKVNLLPINWKGDSYPSTGEYPQQVINKQLVDSCDAIIAVFRNRFGTPTKLYNSGTEEEILLMKEQNKKILVYFLNQHISDEYTEKDIQKTKINEFQETCKTHGILFWKYNELEEFKKCINRHIYKHFIDEENIKSVLSVTCFNKESMQDTLVFQSISNLDFIWLFLDEKNKYIINKIKEIDQIKIIESPSIKKQNPLNKLSQSSIYFFEQRIYIMRPKNWTGS
ncbi:MAG: hypothetical protein HPY53_15860 [Brevinematales bacterium]|nr:hypothetical protein [Brevinematales bacterium]